MDYMWAGKELRGCTDEILNLDQTHQGVAAEESTGSTHRGNVSMNVEIFDRTTYNLSANLATARRFVNRNFTQRREAAMT